jgi:hypothetical protein
MMSDNVPAAPNPNNYSPDEILLYGVPLNTRDDYATLPLGTDRLRLEVHRTDPNGNDIIVGRGEAAIALIYGYAFEGHCYRLDRPKVLLFNHPGGNAPADGCGFDTPYRMWRIRKKTPILELSTSFEFAETLILESNLPGRRAPNTYNGEMQLAHRGGRLTRGSTPA